MVSKQWLRAAGFAALADYRDIVLRMPERSRPGEDPDWQSAIDTFLTRVEY